MSDSDDTDILLLIPPNFFLTEANASLNYDSFQSQLKEKTHANASDPLIYNHSVKRSMDSSKSYFTPTKSRCEQPSFAYRKYDQPCPQAAASFSSPSIASKLFPSSTPYLAPRAHLSYPSPPKKHDPLMLDRVDRYLGKCTIEENRRPSAAEVRHSLDERRSDAGLPAHDTSATKHMIETPGQHIQRYASKPSEDDILNSLVSNKMSDWNSGLQKSMTQNDEGLISLASVWNGDDRGKCDAVTTTTTNNAFQEQELRIRQYERTIQNLQTQLKQYQDKCSDAIKMDQTKNEALARLHEDNSRWIEGLIDLREMNYNYFWIFSLIANISQLEGQLSDAELKFHRQTNDLKAKIRQLQEENEKLDRKANGLLLYVNSYQIAIVGALIIRFSFSTRTTNDVREIHRKQLHDAETRLANSKHAENKLSEELSNLKTKYVQLQNANDDEKRRADTMQMQLTALQKDFREKEVRYMWNYGIQKNIWLIFCVRKSWKRRSKSNAPHWKTSTRPSWMRRSTKN